MRALLAAEDWSFSGELGGLDDDDPELVFYQNRPAGPRRGSGIAPADSRLVQVDENQVFERDHHQS